MAVQARRGFVYVIVTTVLLYLASIAIMIVPILRRFGIQNSILPGELYNVYESYPLKIDVPFWYFAILGPIVLWQLLALSYCLSTLCRHNLGTAGKLYYAPPYMPITMYAMYGTAAISQIAWVFAWSYKYIGFAMAFQAMMSFTIFMAMHFSSKGLLEHCSDLALSGQMREIRMVRGLVQNGFAMFSGYTDFFVTMLFGKVLVYWAGVGQDPTAIIIFSVYAASMMIFLVLEMTVWEENGRYMITHHIVAVFSMASIVVHNFGGGPLDTVHYIIIGGLAVVCLGLLAKVINAGIRGARPDKRLMVGGTSVRVKC